MTYSSLQSWPTSIVLLLAGLGSLPNHGCSSTGGCAPTQAEVLVASGVPLSSAQGTAAQRGECSIRQAGKRCSEVMGEGGAGGAGAAEQCIDLFDVTCTETYVCTGGRRHTSWRRGRASLTPADQQDVGAWYARAAADEAGSVRSFRALAQELRSSALGAGFSRRLRAAAREEVRHARSMRGEAQRRGAARVSNEFSKLTSRSLLDIALENAKQGCVEETWAALVAQFQALHASATPTKQQFSEIAADEARHAELAWDLHAQLRRELGSSERARLDSWLTDSIEQLRTRTATHSGPLLQSELGLPSAAVEVLLRARLASALRARQELLDAG